MAASGRSRAAAKILQGELEGLNDHEIAQSAGCSVTTVRRERRHPAYRQELAEAKAEQRTQLAAHLVGIERRAGGYMEAAIIRCGQYLAEPPPQGLNPNQLADKRLRAAAEIRQGYFAARTAGRDLELEELREQIAAQAQELALLRELVLGGDGDQHRESAH